MEVQRIHKSRVDAAELLPGKNLIQLHTVHDLDNIKA